MTNQDFGFSPYAEISVKKLNNNLEYIKSISNGSKLICVVKSDAYGHGMKIACYMDKYADGFAVSRLDEAIKLRYLGIKKRILMLIPISFEQLRIAEDYDVSLCVDSLERLREVIESGKNLSIHFAVDTGMKRLGFCLSQFESAVKILKNNKKVRVEGVYSHFSAADDNKLRLEQTEKFNKFLAVFDKYFDGLRHISASGGLISGVKYDAVRVGILCYGYKPFECDAPVEPIMKIYAKPLKVASFENNDKCLYNSAVDSGRYSLVNYGYADGLPRKSYPTRCMDLSYVNYSRDSLVLDNAEELAKKMKTIPYEILTLCTKRIKKVYNEDL